MQHKSARLKKPKKTCRFIDNEAEDDDGVSDEESEGALSEGDLRSGPFCQDPFAWTGLGVPILLPPSHFLAIPPFLWGFPPLPWGLPAQFHFENPRYIYEIFENI